MVRLVVRRPVHVAQQSSVLRNSYDLASNERTFNRHESLEQRAVHHQERGFLQTQPPPIPAATTPYSMVVDAFLISRREIVICVSRSRHAGKAVKLTTIRDSSGEFGLKKLIVELA
jgi:hypothetical protein